MFRPRLFVQTVFCAAALAVSASVSAAFPSAADELVVDAKKAYQQRNQKNLAVLRDTLLDLKHPLAGWADYWALMLQLKEASPEEVDQFFDRWGNDYVADRMRNDWLLELGRREDWATFLRIQPSFIMNDDRSVTCYAVLANYAQARGAVDAQAVAAQARQLWWSQVKPDVGCNSMAQTLVGAGILTKQDIWRKVWLSYDANQSGGASQAIRLFDSATQRAVAAVMANPGSYLRNLQAAAKSDVDTDGLYVLAIERWANTDPNGAMSALRNIALSKKWGLSPEAQAWAWASVGREAAASRLPIATEAFQIAWNLGGAGAAQTWSPETVNWAARAALRAGTQGEPAAWGLLEMAVAAMPPDEQQDDAWVYWVARARLEQSDKSPRSEAKRQQAKQMLTQLASQTVNFYSLLARDDLGKAVPPLPAKPAPLTAAERASARSNPGLTRALLSYALEMRSEGAREWNYVVKLREPGGMSDRNLLAAAELACQNEVWDRCINTSELTKQFVDLSQRFPLPFKGNILNAAQSVGLEPAYMFGLIRQESRFYAGAKSHVGASGLMQVMPATASWTARKLGMNDYSHSQIHDKGVNLKIGAGYLKLMIDEFAGSQAMAAAGYNAGPGRPRQWREGPILDAAAWAENIPFSETRDYVKKVLANTAAYAHILQGKPLTLRHRLGVVGPRMRSEAGDNRDLP